MVSGGKKRAEGSAEVFPWRSYLAGVNMRSIKEISREKNYIWLERSNFSYDAMREAAMVHVAQVKIAGENGRSAAPSAR